MYYLQDDNILSKFRTDLVNFKLTWATYAKEYDGLKMRALDLIPFFKELKGDLGMHTESAQHILRNIVKMSLERYFYLHINIIYIVMKKGLYTSMSYYSRL